MQILSERIGDVRKGLMRQDSKIGAEYKNTTKGAPWRPRTISCSDPYTHKDAVRVPFRRSFAIEDGIGMTDMGLLCEWMCGRRSRAHLELVPVAGRHGGGGGGGSNGGRGRRRRSERGAKGRRRRADDATDTRQLTELTVVGARERGPAQCGLANASATHARSRIFLFFFQRRIFCGECYDWGMSVFKFYLN